MYVRRPVNHFPLEEQAVHTLFFAGGIGVTPLIAMAHRLHALGRPFEFHYSARSREVAGFLDDLAATPWTDRVRYHFSAQGDRADLAAIVPRHRTQMHLYACGSPRFMDAVFDAATAQGWPASALHREYFTAPESTAWTNHPFLLVLSRSGRTLPVAADQSATDALAAAGVRIDLKCTNGLCGVCATAYDEVRSDEVEHRDFVLSRAERSRKVILCCSRPRQPDGRLVVDL